MIERRDFLRGTLGATAPGMMLSASYAQEPRVAAKQGRNEAPAASLNRQNYRVASWWFRWEDFNYPDKGVEDRLRRRAVAFKAAGIDLALVFGLHFRWDYVYCFDRVHELIRFSREACHEQVIRPYA